jgi:hypothetical protein
LLPFVVRWVVGRVRPRHDARPQIVDFRLGISIVNGRIRVAPAEVSVVPPRHGARHSALVRTLVCCPTAGRGTYGRQR